MALTKITDLTPQLGLTSRSLRYYEEVGLIRSVRLPGEKYRFYDAANIERLHQIVVLRKMMIPIKDILRIYQSEDMSVVVEVFVDRIQALDREAAALSELRRVTDEFLKTMLKKGVKRISALPLLYEALANEELEAADVRADSDTTFDGLSALSQRLSAPIEPSIVRLPAMRVLSSYAKGNPGAPDPEGFRRWVQRKGLSMGEAGSHDRFEYQTDAGDVCILRVDDAFENDGPYRDSTFAGGLFASANVYLDEDLRERFRTLVAYFDDNRYYEIDYAPGGGLRHPALLENLLSPDEQRDLVALLVPVKKRLADAALFEGPTELAPGAITVAEIERANPILWSEDVAMGALIPINGPHYRVTEAGEAEYISWISTRVLSTGVEVKLPFRVDIEFRIGEESGGWGHGKNEGSVRFHHGPDLNYLFGVNMYNNPDERLSEEAIAFYQPIFGDYFCFKGRGGIRPGVYNRLTWIVGPEHLAVMLNGEVRYCGTGFPYMAVDPGDQRPQPIIIGSDSSIRKYYRAIRVSQLVQPPKTRIQRGALALDARRSNNTIANIHPLITSEYGENYHFNGCARYVMESLGAFKDEPDWGYWFFAGLTGDVLAQVYSYGEYRGEAVTSCMFSREGGRYLEGIFDKCGYAATFVPEMKLLAHRQAHVQALIDAIDRGVPVIAATRNGPPWGVYVGYEAHGKTLLYLGGDRQEPERVPIERAIDAHAASDHAALGWLFIGEQKRQVDLAGLYRDMIRGIPGLFAARNDQCCFGAEAFRAWAEGIESGRLDGMTPEAFEDGWGWHISNICNMATNGSCASIVLDRALALNPDLTFLPEVIGLYGRTAEIWNKDNGNDLECLGAGFNVTLGALQDRERRRGIAARIREAADCMDKVVEIIGRQLSGED